MHTHTFKTKRTKGEIVFYMSEGNVYSNPIVGYEYSHSPEQTATYYIVIHNNYFLSVPTESCFDTYNDLVNYYNSIDND